MGSNNRADYAVHDHPSDRLLRGVLLPSRRIRVWFWCAARLGQRGAVGDWELRLWVWRVGNLLVQAALFIALAFWNMTRRKDK